MNGQFIKNTLIFIGIIVGLSASGFLLVQELSAVPITYASGVDLSGNFPDKNVTIKNISEGDSIYSSLFSDANKQVEPVSAPIVVQPEPIKIESIESPVKKAIAPRTTSGAKCPAKHDRPTISQRNHTNHMDEDCCPDYDEWPKPGCAYTAEDFKIMLPGPTPGHIKHH